MFSSKTIIYWIELVSASFVVSKSVVQYWRMVLSSSLWKKAYTHYDILFKKLMFCFVGSLSWTLQRSFYFKSPFENCHYCPSSCKMFNFHLLPITSDLWWSPLLSCRPHTSISDFSSGLLTMFSSILKYLTIKLSLRTCVSSHCYEI
jgi:hypothetical protein